MDRAGGICAIKALEFALRRGFLDAVGEIKTSFSVSIRGLFQMIARLDEVFISL